TRTVPFCNLHKKLRFNLHRLSMKTARLVFSLRNVACSKSLLSLLAVLSFFAAGPSARAGSMPARLTWAITGNLGSAREHHTAFRVAAGRVLAAGSTSCLEGDTAELWDPVTGFWTFTGQMRTVQIYGAAVLLQDGRVLVTGGGLLSHPLKTCEIYDPSSGQW